MKIRGLISDSGQRIMFFDGIKDSYQIGTLSMWKQLANVAVDSELTQPAA
jgi:hypothetical protein